MYAALHLHARCCMTERTFSSNTDKELGQGLGNFASNLTRPRERDQTITLSKRRKFRDGLKRYIWCRGGSEQQREQLVCHQMVRSCWCDEFRPGLVSKSWPSLKSLLRASLACACRG